MFGWGHTDCPSQNALAPLMMQQSKPLVGVYQMDGQYMKELYLYESVDNFK